MPKYEFDSLTIDDLHNSSLLELDSLIYPSRLCWSYGFWEGVVKKSVINRVVRNNENGIRQMVGNIEVLLDSDRLNQYVECFLIYNIIIHPGHQNQGLATMLMHETAQAIVNLQDAGWYTDYDHIDLMTERNNQNAIKLYAKCGFTEYTFPGARAKKIYMRQNVVDFADRMSQVIRQKSNNLVVDVFEDGHQFNCYMN